MADAARPTLMVRRPGRVAYADGLRLQADLVAQRQRGEGDDTLLLLEHPRVLTLGRNTRAENVLLDEAALRERGFETFEVGRGGDVTYHGPGQLVGYPILALGEDEKDAHAYLRRLEDVLIATLADFGVDGFRHPPHTGVWVDRPGGPRKVAAIGVRLSRWVTSHGFALNVDCDLADFDVIVPCGIRDYGVTSMAEVLGGAVELDQVASRIPEHFARIFGRVVLDEAGVS
jgi:lipoyl(octanoyl) transferase